MLGISTFYLHKRSYKSRFLPFLLLIFPSFVLDFGRTICLMPFGLLSLLSGAISSAPLKALRRLQQRKERGTDHFSFSTRFFHMHNRISRLRREVG